jgi:hypothetical protein
LIHGKFSKTLLDGVCNPVRHVSSLCQSVCIPCWTGFATPSVTFQVYANPSPLLDGVCNPVRHVSVYANPYPLLDGVCNPVRHVSSLCQSVFSITCWTGFATPSVTFQVYANPYSAQSQNLSNRFLVTKITATATELTGIPMSATVKISATAAINSDSCS